MTFPFRLVREFELNLFVGVGGLLLLLWIRLGLVFRVLVGPGEDAEGHGNSGFKVQVDDLISARLIFLSTKGKRRRVLLLLSLQRGLKEKGVEEADLTRFQLLGSRVFFQGGD